ncbi:MAG: NUDIX domain-containing protein [Caulobacteraceae bacterium]|nr:NUDIX domain-containing protein [Caulobacteraceae bacterium]
MALSGASSGNRHSAGLLVFRRRLSGIEFLLVHPGGPFWKNRDDGAWSVPKGLPNPGEDDLAAAMREFEEEVGLAAPRPVSALTPIRQASGKRVVCWMAEADLDLLAFKSGEFEMEWPPRSGRTARFPECDRAAYWPAEVAMAKVLPSQRGLLAEASQRLG